MRDVPHHIKVFLQSHEGMFLKPYLCPAKVWTYGVGATRDLNGNRVTASTPPLTQDQAFQLLERDLRSAMRSVDRLIKVPLTNNAYFALVSFVFNLGGGALQVSTLRKVINRGELDRVKHELNKWVWAGRPKRKLAGLIRRRHEEGELFFTQDMQVPMPEPEEVDVISPRRTLWPSSRRRFRLGRR
jgi:lysozyme